MFGTILFLAGLLTSVRVAWKKNNNQSGIVATTDNDLIIQLTGGQLLNGLMGVKVEIQKLSDSHQPV